MSSAVNEVHYTEVLVTAEYMLALQGCAEYTSVIVITSGLKLEHMAVLTVHVFYGSFI